MEIKIGIICPDRCGDRPQFLQQFKKYMAYQTLQPEILEIVDYPPISQDCDITPRYRLGYDKLRGKGLDIIAFCENDEFYSPNYLDTMVKAWIEHGKTDLFGTNYTIYYNLRLKAHLTFNHTRRCSMMSTLMKPDLVVDWGPDTNPYTDSYLWLHNLNRATFKPDEIICLGMKHNIGKCGGQFHSDGLDRYINKDLDGSFLKSVVGEDSYQFYSCLFPEVSETKMGISKHGIGMIFK